jgi:naringenin degradation protein FdeH
MTRPTRRVVTGHDANGRAVVLFDGDAPNARLRKATGLTSTLLWVTDGSPADNSGSADSADRDIGVAPPPRGTIFRVVDFPPAAELGAVDNAAMLREMGLSDRAHADPRHAAMHRTKSIDYAVVISGEIDMLLDDSEVHLGAGDVLVQRGTSHAWVNRGKESCRIAFVLVDAEEPVHNAVSRGADPRPR